jgi:hypothetical protein
MIRRPYNFCHPQDVFFCRMSLSIDGIAWSEKRDEMKQASINTWEIGFIPFFRTNVSA